MSSEDLKDKSTSLEALQEENHRLSQQLENDQQKNSDLVQVQQLNDKVRSDHQHSSSKDPCYTTTCDHPLQAGLNAAFSRAFIDL